MPTLCACEIGLSNTGFPGCVPIMKTAKKFAIVPYRDNDGNINKIDLAATLDAAFFSALINQADTSKRWFVTEAMDNVIDVRGDAVTFELDGGEALFVEEGTRTFASVFAKSGNDPVYLGKLKAARCVDFAIFVFDTDGNIIGNGTAEAGFLHPLRMSADTWIPGLTKATKTTPQLVSLTAGFDPLEADEDLRMILASEITGVNVCTLKGLLDVNAAISAISTTGFTADLTLDYGSAVNPLKVEGLLVADLAVAQIAPTPAAVVILTAPETSPGIYAITFAAETPADTLRLTIPKIGLEAKTNSILIP